MGNTTPVNQHNKAQMSYYIGVAAVDKEPNSRKLKVYCRELLPYVDDKLNATEVKNDTQAKGDTTGGFQGQVTTKNYLECEYLDMVSNRVFPPDVRKGEQVMVVNLYNADIHYWMPMGRDDKLRRGERYRIGASDDVQFNKELNEDNSWFIEIDTMTQKSITIQTSKSDTETPVDHRYTIKIDALASTIRIMDDDDNEICLNSKEQRIYLRNREKSIIDINKKNIILEATEDIVLNYGRQLVRNGPACSDLSPNGTMVMQAQNMTIKCSDTFTIDAPKIGFGGGEVRASGPMKVGNLTSASHGNASPPPDYKGASVDVKSGKGSGGNS